MLNLPSPVQGGPGREDLEMLDLYHSIESRLPEVPHRIIQFISSRPGEGTSTVVRQFAEMLAMGLCKSVVILEAGWKNPTHRLFFNIEPDCCWDEAIASGRPLDKALYQVGNSSMFISPISALATPLPNVFQVPVITNFLGELRKRFDFALIDSPPGSLSPEGIALSGKVDGVVLVVEAEKTRWPVAEGIKKRIVQEGGNLLGVVFNKRRYYIPGFIYKHL